MVLQRHDPRVDDRHAEFVEHRGRVSKGVLAPGCIQHGFDPVAAGLFAHVDEADFGFGVGIGQPLGMPRNLVAAMAQEIPIVHQPPYRIDALVADVAVAQHFAGLGLLFENQLVGIDRVLEAVPERTRG